MHFCTHKAKLFCKKNASTRTFFIHKYQKFAAAYEQIKGPSSALLHALPPLVCANSNKNFRMYAIARNTTKFLLPLSPWSFSRIIGRFLTQNLSLPRKSGIITNLVRKGGKHQNKLPLAVVFYCLMFGTLPCQIETPGVLLGLVVAYPPRFFDPDGFFYSWPLGFLFRPRFF